MTAQNRPTERRSKAELLAELDGEKARTDAAVAARDALRTQHESERARRDKEAVAIEAVVSALQPLEVPVSNGYASAAVSAGYQHRHSHDMSIERVLTYVRHRFGLADPGVAVAGLHQRLAEETDRAERAEQQLDYIRSSVGGSR